MPDTDEKAAPLKKPAASKQQAKKNPKTEIPKPQTKTEIPTPQPKPENPKTTERELFPLPALPEERAVVAVDDR